jgi:hypothetical protein
MAAAPEKLAALRQLLAERFPDSPRPADRVLPTGIPAVDDATGGLPFGAITELVCAAPSCGSHLFLQQLLAATRHARLRVALIDSTDSFDPGSCPVDLLAHLLWVRCARTSLALQAADLLARDANLGLVVLDLRWAPEEDLRRIPGPQWYRMQRAVEPAALALLVATPRASVPSARLRLVLSTPAASAAFASDRPTLVTRLCPTVQRQRLATVAAG